MAMEISRNYEVKKALCLLEAWIESKRQYNQIPAISAALVHEQQMLWSKGFGYADPDNLNAATPETIYRIASISKLFTSTAVMQLHDSGKLNIHEPITTYLPWFKIQNPFQDSPPITIWHLLTHTAGLPREAAFPYWTNFAFPTREQMIEALPRQQLSYPPASQWKYSNLGLALAGEIVEAVSGLPYGQYIGKNILEPLGMTSTSVYLPEEHRERLAVAHGRKMPSGKRARRPFTDSKGLTPAANLSSTVEDMARFAMLQFRTEESGSHPVLKGSSLREMHRVQWMNPDWKSGRGLGFAVDRKPHRTLVGHGGNVAGYTTHLLFSPAEKVAAIIMTNVDDGGPKSIAEKAIEMVAPAVKASKKNEVSKEINQAPDEWKKFTGLYRNHWSDLQIIHVDNELLLIEPESEDPRDSLAQMKPEGENVFRVWGQDGYQEIGEQIEFIRDEEGEVDRVRFGDNYFWPVEIFDQLLKEGKV
jgi:CubicO group peptidase (beta-lactamase class C family)